MRIIGRALAGLLLLGTVTAGAEGKETVPGTVTVEMTDGSRLIGRVIEEDDARVRLRTTGGLEVDVPRESIASIRRAGEEPASVRGLDPNYSRLMFGPTGRPLKKGDGYFSDYELLFPGVAVGVTDKFSIAGGMSVFPGFAPHDQLFYISPRLGHAFSDRAAASVGALYATGELGDDEPHSLAILFGVGTFGGRDRSVTLGFGLAGGLDEGFDPTPIVMVGGTVTVSRNVALVTENWLFLHDDFRLAEQPFGVAVRFFGERLSADVGFVLVRDLLVGGMPAPWGSISYHFGPSRGNRGRAVAPPRLPARRPGP